MKYFIDCEFIEGFHKPVGGKCRHFIDLISIGIVAEDSRTYYAISNEFARKDASPWVKDNVIDKLEYREPFEHDKTLDKVYDGVHAVRKIGKSNKQIAKEVFDFINPHLNSTGRINDAIFNNVFSEQHNIKVFPPDDKIPFQRYLSCPEFYGYYADYDWVLFCSLFGTMMDLPKGFPMYCRDLKQMVDEWVLKAIPDFQKTNGEQFGFEAVLQSLKDHIDYPKQTNEHNALADARWNYELYKFITS